MVKLPWGECHLRRPLSPCPLGTSCSDQTSCSNSTLACTPFCVSLACMAYTRKLGLWAT